MIWVFWISALLILYAYLGYPLWAYIRSRVRPRPWRQQEIHPKVTILMAVHDGGPLLHEKLDHLLSLDYDPEQTEVIVVSDGSQDDTNSILTSCSHTRLRVFSYPEHRGKAVALNVGMREARGEIVVFVDIRPQLAPGSLRQLLSNFADPQVGCAGGQLLLRQAGHEPSTGVVGGFYWRYEQWIRECEAYVDSPLGLYGGYYAVRRELLTPLPEGTILDDMFQPLNVVRQGFRCVLDARAQVWDTWPQTGRGEFQRKVRTLAGNYQLIRLAPWLLSSKNRLRFHLVSHKLLRLAVPFLLVLLFVSSWYLSLRPFYLVAAVLQTVFYAGGVLGIGLGAGPLGKILGLPAAFCLLNAAAVAGLAQVLFSRRPLWKIWVPTTPPGTASRGANETLEPVGSTKTSD